MVSFFLTIHVLLAISLVCVILFQKTDAASLGSGGGASLLSVRGKANFFTRLTAILAALFMANCLILAILYRSSSSSIIVGEKAMKTAPLQSIQEKKSTSEGGTAPLTKDAILGPKSSESKEPTQQTKSPVK